LLNHRGARQGSYVRVGCPDLSGIACLSAAACSAVGTGTGTVGGLILSSIVLSITTASLPGGTVGQTYSATLGATGGNPPYAWKLAAGSARPPWGLSLDHATGVISGPPTKKSETSTFTVEVRDTKKTHRPPTGENATATFTITIADPAQGPTRHQLPRTGSVRVRERVKAVT